MTRLAGLFIVVAGLLLAIGQPGDAYGHAALRSSDPVANAFLTTAPTRITLAFTEPVGAQSSSIQMLDARGAAIDLPASAVRGATMTVELPSLPPGIYNVLWTNVSQIDGHGISGSYPFTILNPDGSVPDITNSVTGLSSDTDPVPMADGIAVRALSLLGLVLVVAGALMNLLWREAEEKTRNAFGWTVFAGTGLLAFATALSFVLIRDTYSGVPLGDLVFNTPAGGYWLTRMGLVLLIAVANTFLGEAPRRTAWALMGCVALYLWAFTATSHAAAGAGANWAKSIDIVHGVAALTWIGAVAGIAIAARLASSQSSWRTLVPRFSLTASVMVFLLLTTGFLSALVEIDTMEKLWETKYGVALLVKLGLTFPLLAVAGYNAKWGKVRLAEGAPGEPRRFLMFATAELALGLAVFGAAAVLTQTTASKSITLEQDTQAYDQVSPFGDLQLRLQIDPNRTGLNTYRVNVADSAGQPIETERVRLTFRYQEDAAIGASTLALSPAGLGDFLGQGPYMTLEGQWRVEVEVRRLTADDVVGFFEVRPAGTPVVGDSSLAPWANPAPGLDWNQFGGLVFVIAGLGFALYRAPFRAFRKEAGWAANGMTMAGFSFGVLLLFGVHAHEPQSALPTNPVTADANSIERGRALYSQNCVSCHGSVGIPPKGLNLNPYPLDLTVHVPQHVDGQLFTFIDSGVPGTAMRAWGEGDGALTEEEIWHLVNFLRTLTPVDR